MTKLLQKLGLDEKMAKNFWAIIIVAFGGAIIYGLPYFRFDYYDAYLEVYHLTDLQMGVFGSILGVFGMISYLLGGVVADRFSTRTILTVSESLPLLPADFTKGPYAVEKTFSFHCVLSPVLTSKGNYVLQRLSSLVMTQIPLNKLTYERCPCIPHARLMRGDEYVIQIP